MNPDKAADDGAGELVLSFTDHDQISKVKARYWRLLDTKKWDEWGEVFTPDAVMDMPEGDLLLEGREAIVTRVRELLDEAITVHHGHMGEIEMVAADEATAIWAMEDYLLWPARDSIRFPRSTRGYGHYYDRYSRADGQWRIARTYLSRLHVETVMQYRNVAEDC
ncbi:MAG TPA: nuclear transport factor 2 family protein [Solirubrobacterales bacterium]|nr:nuclear transport factor 2 family protein [Solirubrobacterales bacterium]